MKDARVLVVGSSNTDMVVKTPVLPAAGETVLGGDLVIAPGGKGANQAVAAARLGAEVVLVARIGSDMFGERAMVGFRQEGLNLDCVIRDPAHPSGVALIMVDSDGENIIAVASGANRHLSPSDLDGLETIVSESQVLLVQLEIPLETVERAVSLAFAQGVRVILNPAPAQTLSGSLLSMVTTITPNESEAAKLTGIFPGDEDSRERAAAILLELGVREVVITLGKDGAFVATGDSSYRVAGVDVETVDTTAAGDAFNGALACRLACGNSLRAAVEFANRAAALSVTRLGAQPSLPWLEELL